VARQGLALRRRPRRRLDARLERAEYALRDESMGLVAAVSLGAALVGLGYFIYGVVQKAREPAR
jgi:hypothetical protein